ncbi:energy transducer TonB [Vibrio sp. Of7-15]|uniref:energy transducer TonB n=1 Tax=Vibrio sp. Of7-15 TaxID=2724879 RepID=UPI001EF1C220|nr:energy transducer TonB [Vibrio sp. Of7-15]MCG7496019.1 energy transducer TonB [Vibrio sp. Of7-15]
MIRLLLVFPMAAVVAFGLFSFMAWMVADPSHGLSDKQSPVMFDMVMVEPEAQTQRRQRVVPDPPKVPEQPSAATSSEPTMAKASIPNTLPNIDVAMSDMGVNLSLPSMDSIGQNQQVMPLYRVEPKYPPKAMRQGLEGQVVLSFTIDEQGKTTDIKLVEAKPSRMFVRPAIRALKRWKYQPKMEAGKAVKQFGQTVTLEFKIDS